jgi:hypothetical protein
VSIPLEDRLRAELREEAGDLEMSAEFVIAAIGDVRARRQRRQKRAVVAVLAVAVGAAIAVIAIGTDEAVDENTPTINEPLPPLPGPPELNPDSLQKAPTASEVSTLPWRDTELPRALPTDIATAPPLSRDPIDHALALIGGTGAAVGVIGEDGRLRRLDGVALEPTREPAGYGASPVQHGALTSDGRLAAFPQPNAVVVVDLASGDSQRFDVPGTNTRVAWNPDQRQILVGREGGPSSILDTTDGSVEAVPFDAYNAAYAPDGTVVEITETPDGPSVSDLVHWRDTGSARRLPLSIWIGSISSPSATGSQLLVAGSGDQIVRTVARYDIGWIVLDIETGQPIAMLGGGTVPYSDWLFGPIGWLDADTVIVDAHGYLLAWTPATGVVERVSEGSRYYMSLAMDALG